MKALLIETLQALTALHAPPGKVAPCAQPGEGVPALQHHAREAGDDHLAERGEDRAPMPGTVTER